MKRLGQFITTFLIVLILAYMQPVFFPKQETKIESEKEKTEMSMTHTSFPYDELETSGFASYIGREISILVEEYGQPKSKSLTNLGYEWWTYGKGEKDFFQVAVKNGQISSIFALGSQTYVTPFKIGMNLKDVADISTIYTNFNFMHGEEEYDVELTEKDMNSRPLIAFDNESFAILHINQSNGKIIAVRYLDKDTLLQLMPYQLNEGQLNIVADTAIHDEKSINENNKHNLLTILNIVRKREKLPVYVLDQHLVLQGRKALSSFENAPDGVLTSEIRQKQWETHDEKQDVGRPFVLDQSEFNQLLKSGGISLKGKHGIFFVPTYDIPFVAMTWCGDTFFQNQLTHKEDTHISIVFSKDIVFMLLSEQDETIESTGEYR